jgi:hypothetical protein
MKYPFKIILHDSKRALPLRHEVQIGHYFVFVKDNKPSSVAHKEKRLLVKGDDKVLPLINQAVRLEGVTITPTHPIIDPISTVVTERDLYRAEQDVVHLFIAFPNAPKNLRLVIKSNGESFTERALQLINGMAIETLSMLTAGSYSAQLAIDNHLLGIPTLFTTFTDLELDLSLDDDLSLELDYDDKVASTKKLVEESLDLDDDWYLIEEKNEEYEIALEDNSAKARESLPTVKESRAESCCLAKTSLPKQEDIVSRTELPDILFYDIVSVSGTKEVVIPLSDSLATFTVEAFAMSEGNWTQNKTTVVVDKPVRVDLELPLAVHANDKVRGRLRAITHSRKARITLTHNGNRVAFDSQPLFEKGEVVDTPVGITPQRLRVV